MKNNLLKPVLAFAMLSIIICSCEKKAEIDTETQTSVDNTIAESAFTQVFPTVNEVSINEEGVRSTNSSCASYTVIGDTANFPANGPVTIVINYDSTAGCLDSDGRLKKGKLLAVFNDEWDKTGSTIEITLQDYYVNNINYSGMVIATNNGNNSYSTSVVNGKCIDPTWTIEYTSNSTVEQIAGADTPSDDLDNVFKFTGSASGVSRKGRKFTTNIVTPLTKRANCNWIESGVMEITPDSLAARSLNFGDGSCNNDAVITINGNNYDIKLE